MMHMPEGSASRAGSLPLIGGILAFDLCNTCSGRGTDRPLEHLKTSGDILAWTRHAGLLDPSDREELGRKLETEPALGPQLLRRMLDLREILCALGEAIAGGRSAPQPCLDELARIHAQCIAWAKLVGRDGSFVWAWKPADAPIDAVLGPIALSALTLLTRTEPRRVKQCQGDHCGWLFLDTTKNNSRRWCEMEVCGNRAKQKRHQGRQGKKPSVQAAPRSSDGRPE